MKRIIVRPPESVGEYREACSMVECLYRNEGYFAHSDAVNHPRALLIVTKEDQLIGSLGILSDDQGLLPTEIAFGFPVQIVGLSRRGESFEALRLAVSDRSDPVALKALVAAMILYSRNRTVRRTWWMTIKPRLMNVLRRYCHLRCEALPFIPRAEAMVEDPGYWAMEPYPIAIRITQEATNAAFAELAEELVGKVDVHLGTFDHHLDYSREETYRVRPLLELQTLSLSSIRNEVGRVDVSFSRSQTFQEKK